MFWSWKKTKKTDKTVVYVSLSISVVLNHPNTFLKEGWVWWDNYLKKSDIDGEMCTIKWVLFPSVFDVY